MLTLEQAPTFEAVEKIVRHCVGEREVDELYRTMSLPDRPVSFDGVPPRILIILFTSRTGSSFSGRLLANTPYFERVREAFNPDHLGKFRARWRFADDAAAALGHVARDGTEHAFGAKCGAAGLVGALYTGFLPALLDRITFVILKRRDAVAQAISNVKALQSGRYHSIETDSAEVRAQDYDRRAIEEKIDLIHRLNDNLHRFCAQLRKPSPVYYYEDICEKPLEFVNSICDRLDLPRVEEISVEVGLDILRDDVSRQWRELYTAGR